MDRNGQKKVNVTLEEEKSNSPGMWNTQEEWGINRLVTVKRIFLHIHGQVRNGIDSLGRVYLMFRVGELDTITY